MIARLFIMLLALGIVAAVPAAVAAQPAPAPTAGPAAKAPPRSATSAGKRLDDRDTVTDRAQAGVVPQGQKPKSSAGMIVGFYLFAGLAVAGSIFVITRKNLIAGVMGMVGTFFAIAALYMMLYAHFLAVIQMLVYAGAIMVLFVFVIMILNKPEDEPYAKPGKAGKIIAGLGMAYLLYRLATVLITVDKGVSNVQLAAPAPTQQGYDWGSTAAVGWNLFNEYLFPFEAVSILLLVAVVGAIAIARPLKDEAGEEVA